VKGNDPGLAKRCYPSLVWRNSEINNTGLVGTSWNLYQAFSHLTLRFTEDKISEFKVVFGFMNLV